MGEEAEVMPTKPQALIFSYGTLKQGFSNHPLLQDMMASGDASFLGSYRTLHPLPLVCGPYRVPFLLNLPGRDGAQRVLGELYAVSSKALVRMDELEGVSRSHYERCPIELVLHGDGDNNNTVILAEAYYAHWSYTEALWKRNGEVGYECYSEEVAKGYIKRKDRPQDITFLDQIRIFISSSLSPADDNGFLSKPQQEMHMVGLVE